MIEQSSLKETLVDQKGRFRSYSLFVEYEVEGYNPLWTIKEREFKGYPSLKLIYMSYEHVPGFEYEFAVNIFGSWNHWQFLTTESGLRKVFAEWKEELEIRNQAAALRAVLKCTKDPSAAGVNAAKYIAEKGYSVKRGRPSKEEVAKKLAIDSAVAKELEDDFERIGLKLVGTK